MKKLLNSKINVLVNNKLSFPLEKLSRYDIKIVDSNCLNNDPWENSTVLLITCELSEKMKLYAKNGGNILILPPSGLESKVEKVFPSLKSFSFFYALYPLNYCSPLSEVNHDVYSKFMTINGSSTKYKYGSGIIVECKFNFGTNSENISSNEGKLLETSWNEQKQFLLGLLENFGLSVEDEFQMNFSSPMFFFTWNKKNSFNHAFTESFKIRNYPFDKKETPLFDAGLYFETLVNSDDINICSKVELISTPLIYAESVGSTQSFFEM
jgi:hypothetical protein